LKSSEVNGLRGVSEEEVRFQGLSRRTRESRVKTGHD